MDTCIICFDDVPTSQGTYKQDYGWSDYWAEEVLMEYFYCKDCK